MHVKYWTLFYKNVEAEIDPDVKNMLRTHPTWLRLKDKAFLFICIEPKTLGNSINLYRVTFSLSEYSGYVCNSFKLKFVEVQAIIFLSFSTAEKQ